MSKPQIKFFIVFGLFFLTILFYSWFSYGMTAPNLVLLKADWFWDFQTWMWKTFFNDRNLTSRIYFFVISLLFICYFGILKILNTAQQVISVKTILKLVGMLIIPLFFSYNMLSFDVFNYIFNARMVVEYQANPHVKVALDFADDPWTRFMHNTHTPAPYWYGWTVFSILPYILGMNKFILTWLIFRGLSVLSVVLLYLVLDRLQQEIYHKQLDALQIAVVFFNPLFLLEIVSNSHNDLWMLVPAIGSLLLLTTSTTQRISSLKVGLSILLLGFSISTKQATLVLVPIWLLLFFKNNLLILKIAEAKWPDLLKKLVLRASTSLSLLVNDWWPTIASILLFLPLLTSRSQQFHPWYLVWSLVWWPFVKIKTWKVILLGLSVSSMFRYLPWLIAGGFAGNVFNQQKLITWLPIVVLAVIAYLWQLRKNYTSLQRIE